jgi:hypothetical protein
MDVEARNAGASPRLAADSSRAGIEGALRRILASREFRASRRSSDFLAYIVAARLDGRADSLKERTIGIDVFHRDPAYDPSEDAAVRVTAGEVRRRLERYYAHEGSGERVRIDLHSGSYVPEFIEVAPSAGSPQLVSLAQPALPHRMRNVALAGGAGLLLFLVAMAWVLLRHRQSQAVAVSDPVAAFWHPIFADGRPILISASYVPVFANPHFGAEPRKGAQLVRLDDQFVGGGDLLATARLSAMFTGLKRDYALKIGSDVSFADLRTHPAVLIGYSYTVWKRLSSGMRFTIAADQDPPRIEDNGAPTRWELDHLDSNRHTPYDYAIVTRVYDPETGAMMVLLAGITQYGTDAAGELVTSPDLLRQALNGAPGGWKNDDLQMVIRADVIGNGPGPPKVIASAYWPEKR